MKKIIIVVSILVSFILPNNLMANSIRFNFDDFVKINNKIYVDSRLNNAGDREKIFDFLDSVEGFHEFVYKSKLNLNLKDLDKIIFVPAGRDGFELYSDFDSDKIEILDDSLYIKDQYGDYSIVINIDKLNQLETKLGTVEAIKAIEKKDFKNYAAIFKL